MNTITVKDWMNLALDRADRSSDVKTKVDEEGKYIRTPGPLCEEIVSEVARAVSKIVSRDPEHAYLYEHALRGKKILVIDTVELIPVLLTFGAEKSNIVYVAPYKYRGAIAGRLGVRVVQQSLLEWETTMKFDVVVGNPPYQGSGDETGGASALWRKFVKIGWDILEDKGQICFIVPRFPNAAKDLRHIFTENQTVTVWTKIGHHFPGIGSSFFAWIVQKTPQYKETLFINEGLSFFITTDELPKDLSAKPILDKVMKLELFECKSSPEYYHTSVADGKNDEHLCSKKNSGLNYKIRRTSGKNYEMWGAVLPTDYHLPKVVLTYSGYPYYKFHDSTDPIGTIKFQSGHILVADATEGENLIHLYGTKLYLFLQSQISGGARGMRGANFYSLPRVPLSKKWADEELYLHFGLTQEEINYIEATVK